jgi:hypothetical protein
MEIETMFDGLTYNLSEFKSRRGGLVALNLHQNEKFVGILLIDHAFESAYILGADPEPVGVDYLVVSEMADYQEIAALIITGEEYHAVTERR